MSNGNQSLLYGLRLVSESGEQLQPHRGRYRSSHRREPFEPASVALAVAVALSVYKLSLFVLPFYTGGDQYYYTLAYNYMPDHSWSASRRFFTNWTGSSEPGYAFLAFMGSRVMPKIIFSALINAALSFVTLLVIRRFNIGLAMAAVASFTMYWLVLLFSAERLSLAFVFLGLAALSGPRLRTIFFITAMLSHFSIVVLFGFAFFGPVEAVINRQRSSRNRQRLRRIATFSAISSVLFIMVGEAATAKLSGYLVGSIGLNLDLIILVGSLLISLLALRTAHFEVTVSFTPIIMAALISDGDRLLMFGFIVLFYYGHRSSLTKYLAVFPGTAYMTYIGLIHLSNIFASGNGFHS